MVFVVVMSFVTMLFQNCSVSRFGSGSDNVRVANSGGQPYDGKPFVHLGPSLCSDGSRVQSRILVRSSREARLVRDECADLANPMDLSSSDFQIDGNDPDQLLYQGQVFVAENKIQPGSPFYIQLSGTLNPAKDPAVYIVDLFGTDSATITSLKGSGKTVICSFSAGAYESGRPDASLFPPASLGNNVGGDRWININDPAILPIMTARLDLASSKGCNGVELDAIDVYANNSGFSITTSQQSVYDQALASAARGRGLLVGLHGSPELVSQLVGHFDFGVAESCYQYSECDRYAPFAAAGKAMLLIEYTGYSSSQCLAASASGFSLAFFNPALNGSGFQSCP
ncbi:MAG: endo alpha-1,4 polygalactosaminidase [Bdellovibrionales bacterium]